MLDPPLILEVEFTEEKPKAAQLLNLATQLVCHCTLVEDANEDASILVTSSNRSSNSKPCADLLDTLLGHSVVTCQYLSDHVDGKRKLFFVFADLAIRIQGDYRLQCTIVDMPRGKIQTLLTKPFVIYPPQSYPGILGKPTALTPEPTTLSKNFYAQGVTIRSGTYAKKRLFTTLDDSKLDDDM
ncbi:hypothetical protein HDU91_007068 [Kappamyces sp. JEL0680]|nr:hypothetical protein HDU91_007068 [Kappamyces sp. JEL0680]